MLVVGVVARVSASYEPVPTMPDSPVEDKVADPPHLALTKQSDPVLDDLLHLNIGVVQILVEVTSSNLVHGVAVAELGGTSLVGVVTRSTLLMREIADTTIAGLVAIG